jgi:acyl dehydratase
MTDFDPAQHRMITAQRWFEDFVVGERFVLPSRTQTSAVFAAFQTASGDTHPVHLMWNIAAAAACRICSLTAFRR